MGRKFRKIEDVAAPAGQPVRKMRYVLKDYEARKRLEREKRLRAKKRDKAR